MSALHPDSDRKVESKACPVFGHAFNFDLLPKPARNRVCHPFIPFCFCKSKLFANPDKIEFFRTVCNCSRTISVENCLAFLFHRLSKAWPFLFVSISFRNGKYNHNTEEGMRISF